MDNNDEAIAVHTKTLAVIAIDGYSFSQVFSQNGAWCAHIAVCATNQITKLNLYPYQWYIYANHILKAH